MECEVANVVSCLFEDDFDLFAVCDRPALMDLVEEYFCCEDPDDMSSGKCNDTVLGINFTNLIYNT